MPKFRKKPVVIEAVQVPHNLNGANERRKEIDYLHGWLQAHGGSRVWAISGHGIDIQTLEGVMRADFDDWIICGVQGEIYPCKPDIFEETYEPVEGM